MKAKILIAGSFCAIGALGYYFYQESNKPIEVPEGEIVFKNKEGDKKAEKPESAKPSKKINKENTKENLAKFLDKDSKDRIGPNIIARIPQVQGGDAKAVAEVLTDHTDDSTVRNEAINLLRRSKDPHLEQHLMKALDNPEETEKFRAYSVQHLYMTARKADDHTKERITKVITEKLNDSQRMVRREAFRALTQLKHPSVKELVKEYIDSGKGEEMRDLVIRAVQSMDVPEAIPSIRKYLDDQSGPVVVAAAYTLGELNDKQSLDKIVQISEDKNLDSYIRKAAKTAAEKMRKKSE